MSFLHWPEPSWVKEDNLVPDNGGVECRFFKHIFLVGQYLSLVPVGFLMISILAIPAFSSGWKLVIPFFLWILVAHFL